MNVFKFINSRDIRDYLKHINYQFSPLEIAWLIWQSRYTSIQEKHIGWQELIDTAHDCEINERPNMRLNMSLHHFLSDLMIFENRCIESIKTQEPYTIFLYKYLLPSDTVWKNESFDFQPNFPACMKAAMDACKAYSSINDSRKCRIRIQKRWFDDVQNRIEVEATSDGEIVNILDYGAATESEMNLVNFGFYGMWFDFPTPFKKGDIICNPEKQDEFELVGGPCVIEQEIPLRSCSKRWKMCGDYSDMLVHGLFQMQNGTIYRECTHSYMDFEFYRKPLAGKKRILKAISNYIKGKISLDLLLNAYHIILSEERAADDYPWNITKDGLELAGILNNS